MSTRYSDEQRQAIAGVLGCLSYTETAELLSGSAPSNATLRKIAQDYKVTVPQVREPKESKPKGKAKVREPKESKPKGKAKASGAGRGRRYSDAERSKLAKLIKKHGLTGTMNVLGEEAPSIVTLSKIAQQNGIKLERGRPSQAA